jgi:hypothetical protein
VHVTGRKWRALAAEGAMAAVLLGACGVLVARTLHHGSRSPVALSASLPAGGHTAATLNVRTRTLVLHVAVANLGGAGGTLLRVSTPAGDPGPALRTAAGNGQGSPGASEVVDLSAAGASAVTVTLNAAVTWRLDFAAGTQQTVADLRGGQLAGIAVTAGSTLIQLTLPRPSGSVPVRLTAGAGKFLLSVPAGVPARVTAAAGAGEVSLDGQGHAHVARGSVFTTPGWSAGAAGFDIDATAGAARLDVTTQAG